MRAEHEDLYQACFAVARSTFWKSQPVSVSQIEDFALRLLKEAIFQVESIESLGGSEEQVVRAVYYIEMAHAIPPMEGDTAWFTNTLQALMEIVYPNTELKGPALEFLFDLQSGITLIFKSQLNKGLAKPA